MQKKLKLALLVQSLLLSPFPSGLSRPWSSLFMNTLVSSHVTDTCKWTASSLARIPSHLHQLRNCLTHAKESVFIWTTQEMIGTDEILRQTESSLLAQGSRGHQRCRNGSGFSHSYFMRKVCVSFSTSTCWAGPLKKWLKAGPDGTASGQMVGLAQTFQCCQAPSWNHTAPLCSWAQGLLLTCRRVFARQPRSGISHGCSNACIAWGTERSGFSVSV